MSSDGTARQGDGFWFTDGSSAPFELDPGLKEYATDTQWKKLQAIAKHGSAGKAAEAEGTSRSTYTIARQAVRKKAAARGYGPPSPPYMAADRLLPPGQVLRGISERTDGDGNTSQKWTKTGREGRDPEEVVSLPDATITKTADMYDAEGNVLVQWVSRSPAAKQKVGLWQEFYRSMLEKAPRYTPISKPAHSQHDELMAVYPIGDHHMGMLAWNKENDGQDYDLSIGERVLGNATDYLIEACRPCKTALIAVLGDYFHYDGILPKTPTSGNELDADSRFPKMIRAGARTLRYTIDRVLEAHEHVYVIIEVGNHDIYSSVFMMEFLRAAYENEPRVSIDTSPRHYHYFQFGKVGIMTHHGHGAKPQDLPLIFATDQPRIWADTQHRHILVGHVHHRQLLQQVAKDHPGVEVESFQVLAPNDSWHSQKGYRSRQSMKAIEFHREFGEMTRHTVRPMMIGGLRQEQGPLHKPLKGD